MTPTWCHRSRADPKADPKAEIARFQGRWEKTEDAKFNLVFDGQNMIFYFNGNKGIEGQFLSSIPKTAPRTFDLKWTSGGRQWQNLLRHLSLHGRRSSGKSASTRRPPFKTDKRPTRFTTHTGRRQREYPLHAEEGGETDRSAKEEFRKRKEDGLPGPSSFRFRFFGSCGRSELELQAETVSP